MTWQSFTLVVCVALLGAVCDACIKLGGQGSIRWGFFLAAQLIGLFNVSCWFWVLRNNKLVISATLYLAVWSSMTLIIGLWYFGETVTAREWCGVGLALVAGALLVR